VVGRSRPARGEGGRVVPTNRSVSPRAQAAVARLPRPRRPGPLGILVRRAARLAPSWKSLVVAFALLALGLGTYVFARESSAFAVRTIEVAGAPPELAGEVRRALGSLKGTSLLKLDGNDVERRLVGIPTVAAASFDRRFPNGLYVYVRVERPLAVLRRSADAWLVSASGRVLRELPNPRLSSLPRIWLPRAASVANGEPLADRYAVRGVAALAELRATAIGARVRDVVTEDGRLTLVLRSGLEVRLHDATKLRLKLAVARRILPQLAAPGYLDLSVPERAVARANPKVEG
jgi:cell division septal protein FtsQ